MLSMYPHIGNVLPARRSQARVLESARQATRERIHAASMLSDTPLDTGPFVVVDIETTGSRPGTHGIVEIGAVRIGADRVATEFETLVAPRDAMPSAVAELTGITPADLADAPPVEQAIAAFLEFAKDAVIVAHSHRFDLGFLDYESERSCGEPLPRPIIDTLVLANRLHPENDRNNLRDLAERYGVEDVPTHRALPDARAAAGVFARMLPALEARGLRTAGDVSAWCGMSSQSALARALPLTTSLPDAPGVYLFRDARGHVVHVGRAKSLRTKVRSYFYATGGGGKHTDIGVEVASVRWLPSVSDLDSLLLESRLVARYRPSHNAVLLRGEKGGWSLHVRAGEDFPALRVVAKPPRSGVVVGPCVNRQALETVAEMLRSSFSLRRCASNLDERLAAKPCPHRDTGACPRPCVGDADAGEYADRLVRALAVFGADAGSWRRHLAERMDHAASAMGFEEAIRYRDALRAYDRCASALRSIRRASEALGSALIEHGNGRTAVHFVRHGYLLRTLRLDTPDGEPLTGSVASRITRILERDYDAAAGSADPCRFTPRQLRDIFLIGSYRTQHAPVEVDVTGVTATDSTAIVRAISRQIRVRRRAAADHADAPR